MYYLIKENGSRPRIKAESINQSDKYPYCNIKLTFLTKHRPKVFMMGDLLLVEKDVFSKISKFISNQTYEAISTTNEIYVTIPGRFIDVNEEDLGNLLGIVNDISLRIRSVIISSAIFKLIHEFLDNKYVIYFAKEAIMYASPKLNALKYNDVDTKVLNQRVASLWMNKRSEVQKCWISGSNVQLAVIDQGDSNPGILWSLSEKRAYESWDRGDDPRRIPLLFKKPNLT